MSAVLGSFQSQLSGVMETVFKAAMYEIIRLVEESFVEELQNLQERLKQSQNRRCEECGREETGASKDVQALKQESWSNCLEGMSLPDGDAPASLDTQEESQEVKQEKLQCNRDVKAASGTGEQPPRLQSRSDSTGVSRLSAHTCTVSPVGDADQLRLFLINEEGCMVGTGAEDDMRATGPAFTCKQCGRSFAQACSLQAHQRVHSSHGRHLCSNCGRGFARLSELRAHQCGPAGEKRYCCTLCGNKFSRLWNLKLHRRIHTQEKPHRCTLCPKSFTRADILKVHQRTHTGERPYHCNTCSLSYKRLDHLKSHQRKHQPPHT